MEECKKALSEVSAIINNIPEELQEKISDNFKKTIEKEKDKEYKPDVNELVIKNNMLPETVIILQMIYRDFLCSEEEREILKKEEQEIANKKYEVNMNRYSYENLFKKRKDDSFEVKDETIENKKMELIEIKPKWYEKIVEFFKSILKK